MAQSRPTGLKIGQGENSEGCYQINMDLVHAQAQTFINIFMDKYYFTQRNGQRIFGPSRNCSNPEPDLSCEIFIGKLPRHIFEDTLVPLLLKAGRFYNLRILLDFDGGNRGFAFVRFMDKKSAHNACSMLNKCQITPNQILVCMMARNNNEIIIGNIPHHIRPNVLFEDLMQLQDIIKTVKFIPSEYKGNYNVVVEFKTHRDAALSRRILIAHRYECWRGHTIVDWASKHQRKGKASPACVINVFDQHFILHTHGLSYHVSKDWYKENNALVPLINFYFY